jgi:hypothetical protein
MTPEQIEQMYAAITELADAMDFYDRVESSTLDEKIAVGRDHHDWIMRAARRGAELKKQILAAELERMSAIFGAV